MTIKLAKIVITNILPSGTSFAVREDNTEGVFINASVAGRVDLEIGDNVEAQLVPNVMHPERTPWLATKIISGNQIEEVKPQVYVPEPSPSLDDLVREELWIEEATAQELAEALNIGLADVQAALDKMVEQGTVKTYPVYSIIVSGEMK